MSNIHYVPRHRSDATPRNADPVWIAISVSDNDPYSVIVEAPIEGICIERECLGPKPTWPTPAESHDEIAKVVREVLDETYVYWTGEKVER